MRDFIAKARVVLTAVPTYGAAVIAVLTVIAVQVVPVLPIAVGVKVAAYVAAALGIVQTVVSVVSRVTPILFPEDKGLLKPEVEDEFWRTQAGALVLPRSRGHLIVSRCRGSQEGVPVGETVEVSVGVPPGGGPAGPDL
jgi:hypothetical protein